MTKIILSMILSLTFVEALFPVNVNLNKAKEEYAGKVCNNTSKGNKDEINSYPVRIVSTIEKDCGVIRCPNCNESDLYLAGYKSQDKETQCEKCKTFYITKIGYTPLNTVLLKKQSENVFYLVKCPCGTRLRNHKGIKGCPSCNDFMRSCMKSSFSNSPYFKRRSPERNRNKKLTKDLFTGSNKETYWVLNLDDTDSRGNLKIKEYPIQINSYPVQTASTIKKKFNAVRCPNCSEIDLYLAGNKFIEKITGNKLLEKIKDTQCKKCKTFYDIKEGLFFNTIILKKQSENIFYLVECPCGTRLRNETHTMEDISIIGCPSCNDLIKNWMQYSLSLKSKNQKNNCNKKPTSDIFLETHKSTEWILDLDNTDSRGNLKIKEYPFFPPACALALTLT